MRNSRVSEKLRLLEPLHLNPQLADLSDQLRFLGLTVFFALVLLASGQEFADGNQPPPLPLAHLDQVVSLGALLCPVLCQVCPDLLNRLASADLLHGDSCLELGDCRYGACSTAAEKAAPTIGSPSGVLLRRRGNDGVYLEKPFLPIQPRSRQGCSSRVHHSLLRLLYLFVSLFYVSFVSVCVVYCS